MNNNLINDENVLSKTNTQEDSLFNLHNTNLSETEINNWKETCLIELFDLIYDCSINNDNPHYGLFRGCYDWHSSVHGFWAIFRISLEINSNKISRKTKKIYEFFNENIDILREVNLLRSEIKFEFPYGRAWLLRLAIDYQKWCKINNLPSNELFNKMSEEVANDLFDRLLMEKDLDDSFLKVEYDNIPWALTQLYDYFNHIGFDEKVVKIIDFVRRNYIKNLPICFADDLINKGFFSLVGNVVLCTYKTQTKENLYKFNELNHNMFNYLDPINIGKKVHQLGLNWSRAWSLKISGFNEKYWKHVSKGWSIHKQIVKEKKFEDYDSYYAYDHWVPQFIVYTITL
jgi:hypothetical protein